METQMRPIETMVGKYVTNVTYRRHRFNDGCGLLLMTQNDVPYVVFEFNFHTNGEMHRFDTLDEAAADFDKSVAAYEARTTAQP